MVSPIPEATLLERCRQRDPEALDSFVRKFEGPIYRYVVRMAGQNDAEDLTQEVFLRAIPALGNFRGEASLNTWIYKVATNVCRQHYRRQRLRKLISLGRFGEGHVDAGRESIDPFESSELRAVIKLALQKLPWPQREAVVLRDVEGLSYEEITQVVGCSVGTVKSRIYYGRTQLVKELERMGVRERR